MDETVFLVQTDTTVGFLSKSCIKLNSIKNRSLNTPCLKSMATFKELLLHVRVPNKYKKMVRYSKNTTYIYPNKQACRVVKQSPHKEFLEQHSWLYSTSANKTSENFDEEFARNKADIIIENEKGFFQSKSSCIIKLGKIRQRKIRV